MISEESISKLRKELPKGFAEKIRIRLLDRGINYSRGMIQQVLNPENPRYNEEIILEAIAYKDDIKQHNRNIEERIL